MAHTTSILVFEMEDLKAHIRTVSRIRTVSCIKLVSHIRILSVVEINRMSNTFKQGDDNEA